jgi:hypothetical protein
LGIQDFYHPFLKGITRTGRCQERGCPGKQLRHANVSILYQQKVIFLQEKFTFPHCSSPGDGGRTAKMLCGALRKKPVFSFAI